jgi:hypothetical protein
MKKAADCLRAAEMVHDSAERAALAKVAACYALLADYVGTRQKQRTTHRKDRETCREQSSLSQTAETFFHNSPLSGSHLIQG